MENKKRLKVFLDSNVFISGLCSEKGAPGKILTGFTLGRIDVVISRKVLIEIIAVIKGKIPALLPALKRFLTSHPPEIIKDPSTEAVEKWNGILNKDDAAVLESAISCKPDYFVTGDRHFFENPGVARRAGLKIIKPKQLEDFAFEEGT